MEFQSKAIVVTSSEEVRLKSNGAAFQKCTVKHIDGPLAGEVFFANRTLKNAEGVEKSAVEPGQEVLCYNRYIDGVLYSDLSTSVGVSDMGTIAAKLASMVSTTEEAQML
jgi:hypothetical protein